MKIIAFLLFVVVLSLAMMESQASEIESSRSKRSPDPNPDVRKLF
jgi:hypothetical protein